MVSITRNASIEWIYLNNAPVARPDTYTFSVLPGFGSIQISMMDFGFGFNPDFQVSKNGVVLKNTDFVFGNQQTLYFDYLEPGQYTITVYLQPNTAPTQKEWQQSPARYSWKYDLDVYSYSKDDQFEDNDAFGQSKTISESIVYSDLIINDDDWYQVTVNSGDNRLNIQASNSNFELYNASGNLVAKAASSNEVYALSSGKYFVKAFPTFSTRGFKYGIYYDSYSVDDSFEQNDTIAQAKSIMESTVYSNLIINDDDWYQLTVNPGDNILNIQATNSNFELYNTSGNLVAKAASSNEFYFASPGKYFVKVFPTTSTRGSQYGIFYDSFSVDDQFEDNDAIGQAKPILESTRYSDLIINDDDWYQLTVNPGDNVLNIQATNSNFEFYNTSGNLVAKAASSNEFYFASPGKYFVKVFPTTSTRGFPYEIFYDSFSVDDYGDLPSTYAGVLDGRHTITQNLKLGTAITDAETAAQPNATATGDDIAGATPDDEDGVTLPSQIVAGQNTTFNVNVTNSIGSAATLYGFVDWNNDGVFTGTGETVTAPVNSGFSGNVPLVFSVPAGAVTGTDLGARFRISTQSGLGAGGQAPNGEVEDYIVQAQASTPSIKIINTAGNVPDGTTLTVNGSGTVTFNYKVSTGAGNVSLSNVAVVDDNGTPGNTSDDFMPTFIGGDTNNNNLLDPSEMWQYQATINLNFDTEIYAYAYAEIKNLKITTATVIPSPPQNNFVQPNTSSGSSLLTANPTPPGQLTQPFDVHESFTSSSQPSGIDLGLPPPSNNTGFFDLDPLNSAKGLVNSDYSRGDAVIASGGSGQDTMPVSNVRQLQALLFGTTTDPDFPPAAGINLATVGESYLNTPVSTLFQTSPTNFYKDQGQGSSEFLITSSPFTVATLTAMRFDYDYLNKLVLQVEPNTPVTANEGNLARAQIGFSIAIVATKSTGGLQQVFLESPGAVNKDVSITTPPGIQSTPTASGSRTNRVATLQRDIDGDNIADQYTLTINGFSRVDTRLVLQDQLLRTNVATVTGTPIGIGGFLQSTDNATVQLNTHPQPAPPLGSASVPNNGLPASNSNEPSLIGAVMPGTESLVPQGGGLI